MKKKRCPNCTASGRIASLEPAITKRGRVNRCWQCGGEYVGDELVYPKPIAKNTSLLELAHDAVALKHLADLEELASVPPERGGYHFSEWERGFIKAVREQHDQTLDFTDKQRAKIKEVWQAADLRKRAGPDEQSQNLFSNLPPARQAEMKAKAKGILPWEK